MQYFEDTTAYLTQSGQLYNEANAMALGRVYAFGPTFRAEKSKTRRHLTEFWMVEPEMAYASLDDTMDLAEELIVSVVSRVLDKRARELKALERDTSKLESVQRPFPRITYDEAVDKLQAAGQPFEWGGDFGGTDETVISQQFDRPVCINRYPSAIKAFYMKPDPVRPEVALGVDVIAPEGYGEIIGGGERLADYDLLLQRIEEHKLPQGSVRLVSRSAALRLGAARRLRDGHRALRRLDLRPRARPRDDPVSAHALPPISVIARRARGRVAGARRCPTRSV